jgi:hypothetical protein
VTTVEKMIVLAQKCKKLPKMVKKSGMISKWEIE